MEENNNLQDENVTTKKNHQVETILVGVIFTIFGLICLLNIGPIGQFFFYISTFLFGVFFFLPFILMILSGLVLIIRRHSYKIKFSISAVGVILFLVGLSIAASNSKILSLSNMMDEFNIAYADISLFYVEHFSDTIACGGGFIGFLFAAILNSALTYTGTIVVYVLLILVGAGLFLFNPIMYLVHYFKDFKYIKHERKTTPVQDKKSEEDIAIQMEEKPVEDTSYDKEDSEFLNNNSAFKGASFARPVITAERAVFNPENGLSNKNNETESSSDTKDDDLPKLSQSNFDIHHEEESVSDDETVEENENLNISIDEEIEAPEEFDDNQEDEEDLDENIEAEAEEEITDSDDEEENNEITNMIDDTFSHEPPTPVIKNQEERREEDVDNFVYPSVDLLNEYEDQHIYQANFENSVKLQQKINDIFDSFNVGAKTTGFKIGPAVTRFEIETDKDVSVNSLNKYIDDVAIRLGGKNVRFEKIVRGMSCSGLEVPNLKSSTVSFKECITPYMGRKEDKYKIPLGKDITGNIIGINFNDFPHLLVAGSTGSGKSIFIHNLIMSIIMKTTPKECRLMLIDPKQLEMSKYNNIPHLMCPILTDIIPTRNALNKLINEMENRYTRMSLAGASKLSEYNKIAKENGDEELPYLVVIIDEYADLVESCKDISTPIVRLAQKSRACGIHLVISTQRPSVNVITGVIKANLPTRIALRVAQPVDSMTILGEGGAEKLLGHGDLLVDSPEIPGGELVRLQSPYVDNAEIRKVVNFLKEHYPTKYMSNFMHLEDQPKTSFFDENGNSGKDEMFDEVKAWVLTQDEVSKSFIQRKYGFGFNRAARIIDILEEEGYVVKDPNGGTAAKMKVIHKDE